NSRTGESVHFRKNARDKDLAIRLKRERIYGAVRARTWVEGVVDEAVGKNSRKISLLLAADHTKVAAHKNFPIGLFGNGLSVPVHKKPKTIVGVVANVEDNVVFISGSGIVKDDDEGDAVCQYFCCFAQVLHEIFSITQRCYEARDVGHIGLTIR